MKIRIQNLRKTYQDAGRELTVLDNLSWDLPEGGVVGVVGRSGTGKSTLLHILGGLDSATSGSIDFGGLEITKLSSEKLSEFRAKHVGFVFQFHHLLPEFSALENVSLSLIIGGASEEEASSKAEKILVRVGLAQRLTHRPSELSGGEQQRVAIARALVGRPDVLLADEPTGNLDIKTAREVQEMLLEINREQANLMVIVTHNPELASVLDAVYEMSPGGALRPLPKAK